MFGVFRYDLDVVCCIERIQTSVSLCNCNCSEFCPHLGFSKVSMSRQADCILIVPLELRKASGVQQLFSHTVCF